MTGHDLDRARNALHAIPPDLPRDANDYAQREGFDALEVLLSRASEPAKPEPTPHQDCTIG